MILIISLYFSFLLTALLVLVFMKIGRRLGMIDEPNHRKVHQKPIPRTGGAAIIIGTMIPLVFLFRNDQIILGVCSGAICILLVGILDDLWGLNYKWKLLGQILAATVTLLVSSIRFHTLGELWPGYIADLGMLSLPLSIFFLVATTNMINLSDGLDGLAGGICLLIFSSAAFLAYFQQDFRTLALCVACGGAIAGFLRYNTHPAIVFMGDTGSQFLGFLVGVTVILLTQIDSIYSPAIVPYILGIPALDLVVVIFERVMNRRPICRANNDHIHHKLLKLGFRHTETVTLIYAMQLGLILIAWSARFADDLILISSYVSLLALLLAFSSVNRNGIISLSFINGFRKRMSRAVTVDGSLRFISRKMIAKLTWCGLLTTVFTFYSFSLIAIRPVPKIIWCVLLSILIVLLMLKQFRIKGIRLLLMLQIYVLGIHYVVAAEYSSIMIWTQQLSIVYNILFVCIGIFYVMYLITTRDKIPFSPLNFLLLALVIFLSFLPKSYLEASHLQIISAKSILIFLTIELFFFKYRTKIRIALTPVVLTLALMSVASLYV